MEWRRLMLLRRFLDRSFIFASWFHLDQWDRKIVALQHRLLLTELRHWGWTIEHIVVVVVAGDGCSIGAVRHVRSWDRLVIVHGGHRRHLVHDVVRSRLLYRTFTRNPLLLRSHNVAYCRRQLRRLTDERPTAPGGHLEYLILWRWLEQLLLGVRVLGHPIPLPRSWYCTGASSLSMRKSNHRIVIGLAEVIQIAAALGCLSTSRADPTLTHVFLEDLHLLELGQIIPVFRLFCVKLPHLVLYARGSLMPRDNYRVRQRGRLLLLQLLDVVAEVLIASIVNSWRQCLISIPSLSRMLFADLRQSLMFWRLLILLLMMVNSIIDHDRLDSSSFGSGSVRVSLLLFSAIYGKVPN